MDMVAARTVMIDSQIRTNDVFEHRLLAAIAAVPREAFTPADRMALAYADAPVPTGPGRFMMMPRSFAKLANAAAIGEDDRVLDVAFGTGYSTAVFANMAKSVVGLEDNAELAKAAEARMGKLLLSNVEFATGPLKAGAPAKGPYNVIFVNGAIQDVPAAWTDQLAEGGRLVVYVAGAGLPAARVYTRAGGKTAWRGPFESAVPVLPGFEKAASFQL